MRSASSLLFTAVEEFVMKSLYAVTHKSVKRCLRMSYLSWKNLEFLTVFDSVSKPIASYACLLFGAFSQLWLYKSGMTVRSFLNWLIVTVRAKDFSMEPLTSENWMFGESALWRQDRRKCKDWSKNLLHSISCFMCRGSTSSFLIFRSSECFCLRPSFGMTAAAGFYTEVFAFC